MLDDLNFLKQRDPHGALEAAAKQYEQTLFTPEIIYPYDGEREIKNVVIIAMGNSGTVVRLMKMLEYYQSMIPIEAVHQYDVPAYVGRDTLVVALSYSGNSNETLMGLRQAMEAEVQVGVITSGGKLSEIAKEEKFCHIVLPEISHPRTATISSYIALVKILSHFGVVSPGAIGEVRESHDFLKATSQSWSADTATNENYAKQLALLAVGKTPVFYGGRITAPLAYKWKTNWNENAKNLAFWNEYPESIHNEFIGWTSHPVEKPFAIFDLVSDFEHRQILEAFELSDRLLSGRRPKANVVTLAGDTLLKQLLWGCILADFVSIYVAVLNGVDPTPVELIEKLKQELA